MKPKVRMFVIACRDFGKDCNAIMKGRNREEAIDATVKHKVSMHGENPRELQAQEKRHAIGSKAKEMMI